MKRLTVYLSFLSLFLVSGMDAQDPSDPNLSQEERNKILTKQEERWEISKSTSNPSTFGFSILKPFIQSFLSNRETVIDAGNFKLTIPAGAFSHSKKVETRITILNKHSDFLFAGVPTQIEPNLLLESTGMFYLAFYDEEGRRIEPKKNLTVEMVALSDPNSSNVYRYTKGNWELLSQSRESTAISEIEGSDTIPFQIYSKIDSSGWWNFDKPKPEFTCVTGRILSKNPEEFLIQGVGIDYFGTSYGNVEPSGVFRINVLKNSNVKIFALFTPKNKNAKREIGFLPIFRTQERTAFSSEKNPQCQKVSEISTFPIEESVFQNRAQFLKMIDMPDM